MKSSKFTAHKLPLFDIVVAGVYEGQVNRKGLPHGHGTLEEGVTYVESEGKVPMKGENGQVLRRRTYVGNWENGLPSDYGRVIYDDKKV